MRFAILALTLSLTSLGSFAQYCQPTADCSRNDFIDDFTFAGITNVSSGGSNCGIPGFPGTSYIYNSSMTASVTQGNTYTLSLGAGFIPQGFAVWIDWNQDGDFDDVDEYAFSSVVPSIVVSGVITVPLKAKPGATRLRVRCSRNTTPSSAQACTTFNLGETEDYNVSVVLGSQLPVAEFKANVTSASDQCDIYFTDLTQQYVSSWLWDFGDGQTSTVENPVHSYQSPGTYTVKLTATNLNGSDTETKTNYMTISSGSVTAASCTPTSSSILNGSGVTRFTLGPLDISSSDATVSGYEDFSCSNTQIFQGQTYTMNIYSNTNALQYYRVWMDFNGDGFLSNTSELVLTNNNVNTGSGTVTIPATAVLNTPIRIRVAGVYNLTAPTNFTACSNLNNGQVEDHAVVIVANTQPPTADFTVDVTTTCDGTVQFTDLSNNVPTSWLWEFGDGNQSTNQNPSHTYQNDGTYSVKLTSTNSFGSDSETKNSLVTVTKGNNVKSNCAVTTLSHTADYGIHSVLISSLNHVTPGGQEGYQDYSCTHNVQLEKQKVYIMEVRVGSANREDVKVWVDWNDNGSFSASELMMNSTNANNHSDTIVLPSNSVLNKAVRMRISSDFLGSNLGPCDDPTFGQVEDYSVTIIDNPNATIANFVADSVLSCSGTIKFTDLSTNGPDTWFWNFGDGNFSSNQNPTHTYANAGTYDVQLVVSKNSISDTLLKDNYIHVGGNVCQKILMPESGSTGPHTSCGGLLLDSGGDGDYDNNTKGVTTISPTGASTVSLQFTAFDFQAGHDYLKIYDGADTLSSLIGQYDGTSLPNGGTVTSTGPHMTLLQYSDGNGIRSGFKANWSCQTASSAPTTFFSADSVNSCTGLIQFMDLSIDKPTSWLWEFGDGGISGSKNPQHLYANTGTYDVKLKVSNANGSDSLIKSQYITVGNQFCGTSIGEFGQKEQNLKVYPNPVDDQLHFLLPSQGNFEVRLTNSQGQVLWQETITGSDKPNVLEVGLFSPGFYVLNARSEERSLNSSIIIR